MAILTDLNTSKQQQVEDRSSQFYSSETSCTTANLRIQNVFFEYRATKGRKMGLFLQ